jgi:hypothetical protein
MSNKRSRPRRRWIIAAVVLLALYVLSSGPTYAMTITFHDVASASEDADGPPGVNLDMDPAPWWPKIYAPLVWVAQQSWGDSLTSYWQLFPVHPPE